MSQDLFHLGIKAIIRNSKGDILLLRKAKAYHSEDKTTDVWDIPGGRIERGDKVEDTLRREISEEIGVSDITEIKPLWTTLTKTRIPVQGSDVGLILTFFTCVIPDGALKLSDEHTTLEWCEPETAAQRLARLLPEEFQRKIAAL